ncbi:MAG: hypothetical protein HY811_02180 [Planctomycetes bacterium]|nr:hypothetical protein [Planctomycetota bacterium]
MSKVISAIDLWIPAHVPPKPDMSDKWEQVFYAVARIINQRRKEKIPDESAFNDKLAEPAIQAWNGFWQHVDASFRSKHGRTAADIRHKHNTNLQGAYNKWNNKLDYVFGTVDGIEAKEFKRRITETKGNWAQGIGYGILRLTGDKIRGKGAATIATYWLIGEPTTVGMVREQDTGLQGGPYQICPDEFIQAFQSALMERLIQAGMKIFQSRYDASVISRENDVTNLLVDKFVDSGLSLAGFSTGGASHLDFVKEGALLKLSLAVSQM